MTDVMGGRTDDVAKLPKQQRNRPLSAVIEEFEVDDSDFFLKNNIVTINEKHSTDDNGNDLKNNRHKESDVSPPPKDLNKSQEQDTSSGNTQDASVKSLPAEIPSANVNIKLTKRDSPVSSPKTFRKNGAISGSPRLGRRATSNLSWRVGLQSDVTDSDDDTLPPSDMTRVRQTADRLRLSTRRPSTTQWRAQYVECPRFPVQWNSGNGVVTDQNGGEEEHWTEERRERINTALDWIKNELVEMRAQDQHLARQLLSIRSDIYQLKLARSCEEHQDMLDDVQSELEELQEFADVLDLPLHTITDSPLKHLGVTRMNLSARRFSTC